MRITFIKLNVNYIKVIYNSCYSFRMVYLDKRSSLVIDDSSKNPYQEINFTEESVKEVFSSYILSASGYRHVFAKSGDEEDSTAEIKAEDVIIVTLITKAYFEHLKLKNPRILLGIDARPTGKTIAAIAIRTLIALGADVKYLFISAAPEIMAYSNDNFDSFYYISASHNPIGHNGFKFGRKGGVFSAEEANELTSSLKEMLNGDNINKALALGKVADNKKYEDVLSKVEEEKNKALCYYRSFVLKTAEVDDSFKADVGIVADFNGSARALSIDRNFLEEIGCSFSAINDKAGSVAHAIVPEGKNLIPCRDYLEKMHKKDKRFILGYTPDNDGDRGNFVYITDKGEAAILEAQEVFALVVAIEVADLSLKKNKNIAVAVNGPTSERIDALASAFGAKVFRAEVGEANVVNLASALRDKGYVVHVLGEGSNGGNITEPAKVRDPLNSVMTILKLFGDKELYNYLRRKLGFSEGEASISGVIEALPIYTTTGAFSSLAKMHIKHPDYKGLKSAFEKLLRAEFKEQELDKYGIVSYEIHQTEKTEERIGEGNAFRSGECKGGLKVVFLSKEGEHLAYMWTRPSGTEPLLRVLVDVKGDNQLLHDKLLSFIRTLIAEADQSLN